eukprot:Skav230631  [mRNA]  locus=scaffold1673:212633:230604:+ [translate_table: standard]
MADLTQIFDSLKDLAEQDGTVAAERLHHVLTKIGMQEADAGSVLKLLTNPEGRVKLEDFQAWVAQMPQQSVTWTDNIILATDSYKFSHWKQYPAGTEYVYSYFESRGCERKEWNEVVFFGLQYFLKRYLLGQVITQAKIDEAVTMCSEHFEGFQYILEQHGGRLPISIKAIPEGMVVPTRTALFTMVNTDPKCYWLTNFLETLLVQVGRDGSLVNEAAFPPQVSEGMPFPLLPVTFITLPGCWLSSSEKMDEPGYQNHALQLTATTTTTNNTTNTATAASAPGVVPHDGLHQQPLPEAVYSPSFGRHWQRRLGNSRHAPCGSVFKLHDFGFRGVSSVESAALGGAAHLVNFLGTDTVAALLCCRRYYGASKAAGHSIPASEHSTITSWGVEHEKDAMKNMLQQYPSGLVACVSDSFDVFKACKEYWGEELKDLVKGRISGESWGRLVVRPDSGDPTETCVKIVTILCEQFKEDVVTTKTGHKLLPPYIRVIQGDGVDYESVPKILAALRDAGATEITVNGQAREVFKGKRSEAAKERSDCAWQDPITDKGKASKKGRLTVQRAEETVGREEAGAAAGAADSPKKAQLHRLTEQVMVPLRVAARYCIEHGTLTPELHKLTLKKYAKLLKKEQLGSSWKLDGPAEVVIGLNPISTEANTILWQLLAEERAFRISMACIFQMATVGHHGNGLHSDGHAWLEMAVDRGECQLLVANDGLCSLIIFRIWFLLTKGE